MSYEDPPRDPLKEGIAATIAEDWERARRFLWQAVSESPRREIAWLWLSKVSENLDEFQFCLAKAVSLNPENRRARMSLEISRSDPRASARPPARGRCLICGLAYAQPAECCSRCRCVTSFDCPEVFLQPLDVDRELVRRALRRVELGAVKNHEKGLRIEALCRLNLGEPCEALGPLRILAVMRPGESLVRRVIEVISGTLDDIQIESGFETEAVDRPTPEELGSSGDRSTNDHANRSFSAAEPPSLS